MRGKACPRFRRSREAGSAARGSRIRGCRTHLETSLLLAPRVCPCFSPWPCTPCRRCPAQSFFQLFIRLVDGVPHRDGLPTSRSVRRCASVSRGPRCVCVRDKERPMREAGGRSSVRSGRSARAVAAGAPHVRVFPSSRARGNIPVSGVPVKARLTECPYASRASGEKGNRACFRRFQTLFPDSIGVFAKRNSSNSPQTRSVDATRAGNADRGRPARSPHGRARARGVTAARDGQQGANAEVDVPPEGGTARSPERLGRAPRESGARRDAPAAPSGAGPSSASRGAGGPPPGFFDSDVPPRSGGGGASAPPAPAPRPRPGARRAHRGRAISNFSGRAAAPAPEPARAARSRR